MLTLGSARELLEVPDRDGCVWRDVDLSFSGHKAPDFSFRAELCGEVLGDYHLMVEWIIMHLRIIHY
jgi:hypothetical protein